ncbi:unnamed protein product, partial [Prorocentrum cordatum]
MWLPNFEALDAAIPARDRTPLAPDVIFKSVARLAAVAESSGWKKPLPLSRGSWRKSWQPLDALSEAFAPVEAPHAELAFPRISANGAPDWIVRLLRPAGLEVPRVSFVSFDVHQIQALGGVLG